MQRIRSPDTTSRSRRVTRPRSSPRSNDRPATHQVDNRAPHSYTQRLYRRPAAWLGARLPRRTADLPIRDRLFWTMPGIARHYSLAGVLGGANTLQHRRIIASAQQNLGIKWGVDLARDDLLGVNSRQRRCVRPMPRSVVVLSSGGTLLGVPELPSVAAVWAPRVSESDA